MLASSVAYPPTHLILPLSSSSPLALPPAHSPSSAFPVPYLVVEVFPVVLGHEAEQRQEGPAERVKAGVAVVRVTSRLQAVKAVWALPVWVGRKRQRKNIYIYIIIFVCIYRRMSTKVRQLEIAT